MSVSSDSTKLAQSNTVNNAASQSVTSDATPNHKPSFSHFTSDVANSWLLPDGVVDVLFEDARKQEVLRYQLTQQLIGHGYQLVNPPMIEFT
ncbi:MAG: ATP phosphoribosyltransferase regulatory subunit, partial [Psychrobacter sp.]|nr:ATP phosphoribosyltransferase regulatory subunit [Psychrobacter sp.]